MTYNIRTKISAVEPGVVFMRHEDPIHEGDAVERTFTVRRDGERGYVYEVTPRGDRRQVCERLSSQGSTLMADTDTLLAVIRREYKRSRASA
jgi:hypothetical protein